MNIITLFLPDFREFIRNNKFKSESNTHPVFYYDDMESGLTYFYKPIDYIIYTNVISNELLPDGITISELKSEFDAIEIPRRIDEPKSFNGIIV